MLPLVYAVGINWIARASQSNQTTGITLTILLLPWLINGGLLAALFWRRPQMGQGFIAAFLVAIAVVLGCGLTATISCVGGLGAAENISPTHTNDLLAWIIMIGIWGLGAMTSVYVLIKGLQKFSNWLNTEPTPPPSDDAQG